MSLISLPQAARRWGIDTGTLRKEIREGRLPAHQDAAGQWWVDSSRQPVGGQNDITPMPDQVMRGLESRLADLSGEVAALRDEMAVRRGEIAELRRLLQDEGARPTGLRRWWWAWKGRGEPDGGLKTD